MLMRTLGHSGIEVGAIGMGCWAIGGPFWRADGGPHWHEGDGLSPGGWGKVDDDESIRAIQAAIDLGVNVFDTASSYGCGHSEVVLGKAIIGQRDKVIIATKFANVIDEEKKIYFHHDASPEHIRDSCEASLRRLNTDYIDIFQLHWSNFDGDVKPVLDTLERLVAEGKIRWYGWSTDDPERMRKMTVGDHCLVVQHAGSVFRNPMEMLGLCDEFDLVSLVRSPLSMGLLTGKYDSSTTFPEDDIRHTWQVKSDDFAETFEAIDAIREILTSGGRTVAQGALAYIWGRSERSIPIPGFRNSRQAAENARAMEIGPLSADQMGEVESILAGFS